MVSLPTLQAPTIHKTPEVNLIGPPDPQIVTKHEFDYYHQACEDFLVAGQEDEYDLDELKIMYPGLTRTDVCDYTIFGLPTQAWFNLEADLNTLAGYIQRLKAALNDANQQLIDQYNIITKATEEIKEQLESYDDSIQQ